MAEPTRGMRIADDPWVPAGEILRDAGVTPAQFVTGQLARLAAGELRPDGTPGASAPASASTVTPLAASTSGPASTLHGAVPSPGVACCAPGCWARDTARYGLRRVPLCPADAAALGGLVYQRPAHKRPA